MMSLWFDDLRAGDSFTSRGTTLTEGQIVQFAFQFDPQPFHMDAHAAARSQYGGIIASGLHTLSVACRLVQQDKPWGATAMGAPGMDDLRWLKPVRPGDTLHVVTQIKSLRPSASKPDRGIVQLYHAVYNQHDELVMDYAITELVARRDGDTPKQ
ncbi:MAG TPA: MaoC family dehydratase [bacterium]|nr:MaoC family dehydratase [bacterium]